MIEQLTLNFAFHEEYRFDNFVVGSNLELLTTLKLFIESNDWDCLLIYGKPGLGKTHLLHAGCSATISLKKLVCYFDLAIEDRLPTMLEGLEQFDLIVLDNIDAVFGNPEWEEALFDCYNRLHSANKRLILSTKQSPSECSIDLPDLRSRLLACVIYQIKALDDEDKIKVLKARAGLRGLELSDEVGQYLITHYSRDLASLLRILNQLDHASMMSKRRLTVPFVKSVLVETRI